ncbi:MAG TPA: M14 family zinc carboxypeptidase, partial [Anaerolineaceae bacterium]|nr:M14 family zinc carboxypeptidase [Anaerolineaceae bacterium]
EYTTAETSTRLIEYLVSNYGVDPDITWMLDYMEIYVLPMTNPDGRKIAETGLLQRKNRHNYGSCTADGIGVDLNRNSDFHYGGASTSTDPCDELYRGPFAQSEMETRAIALFTASIFPDLRGSNDGDPSPSDYEGLFITLHSYSDLILWPYGFDSGTYAPNHTQLQTLGRKMAYFNGYTPEKSSTLYPTSGSTDDWAYGVLGVPAFTYEMGSEFFEECAPFESTIWPDNRNALLYAFKAARRGYQTPSGPESLTLTVGPSPVTPGTPVTLTASANDTRYAGGETTQNIQAARYSIDLPSWQAGAVTYPMNAADGSFNSKIESVTATIDTTALSSGRHMILVESQDINGNWGVPSAVFLQVSTPNYALSASAAPTSQKGEAGQNLEYALTIQNTGMQTDSYTIQVTSSVWQTLPATTTVVSLGRNAVATVPVTVSIPVDAIASANDIATIKITSQGDPAKSATLNLSSSVYAHAVLLSPAAQQFDSDDARTATYTVTIANTGETNDTFNITINALWTSQPSQSTVGPLTPGQMVNITVTVIVPQQAVYPASDLATVTATSQTYSGVHHSIGLTTNAPRVVYLPVMLR